MTVLRYFKSEQLHLWSLKWLDDAWLNLMRRHLRIEDNFRFNRETRSGPSTLGRLSKLFYGVVAFKVLPWVRHSTFRYGYPFKK